MTQKPNYGFAITVCVEYLNRMAHKATGEGKDAYAMSLRNAADALWREREALATQTRAAFGEEGELKPWHWKSEVQA